MRIVIDWTRALREVAILVGFGLFMAVLNPFGSVSDVPMTTGIVYWVSLIVYGGLVSAGLTRLLRRLLPKFPLWGYVPVFVTSLTLAVMPVLMLAQSVLLRQPIPLHRAPEFAFYVVLVATLVTGVLVMSYRTFGLNSDMFDPYPSRFASVGPDARLQAPAAARRAAFVDRLPAGLRTADIYAVESEDHYLRVHTSAGSDLILMRLADAVRELAEIEGLQVHRSWWVARNGVAEIARANGRMTLKLKSGVEAPVSRTYASAVREAGWG